MTRLFNPRLSCSSMRGNEMVDVESAAKRIDGRGANPVWSVVHDHCRLAKQEGRAHQRPRHFEHQRNLCFCTI